MELLDYEIKHQKYLRENASECALFLKRNDEFPIKDPTSLCLIGSGARKTIKGGTGSGDVRSFNFKTIENAFIENGFNVTSKEWLDKYDNYKEESKKDHIKHVKKEAHRNGILPVVFSMGYFEEEKNYDFNPFYDADICVYVLSRNSGEGNDRRNIEGDIKLSKKEVEDILLLNSKFKKFMLVLNVGGVVDISPVMGVSNILLLSQLGVVTSSILVDIILGKTNPSGKLSTTWAKAEDYPSFNNFGDLNDTNYNEGIYVGYRYFNTINDKILYPFGYGVSYTDFSFNINDISLNKMVLDIKVLVKNIGSFSGKEVIQAYVSKPNTILDNPYIELVNYIKTKELKPNEEDVVSLKIDFTKLYSYDSNRALNVLQEGEYIVRIGNSSINLLNICKCVLNEEVIIDVLNNKCINSSVEELKLDRINEDNSNLIELILDPSDIKTKVVEYKKDKYKDELIESLSDEELARLCLGHYDGGIASIIGGSAKNVLGGAGETSLGVSVVNKSLTMADGPAGLRLKSEYGIDKKGIYDISIDPIMENMLDYLPKISAPFIKPPKNRHGEIHYQKTTAIPIGTALAQSFNDEFVYNCANIVSEEMKIFNVDLWLAPALNIHRNILCGRNFEYFSEDPYVSGRVASIITKGIEKTSGLGVTIKHFACNNQELNRNNNNSKISERALREIYLKGFEICIKEANPKAIMTSYNLINGVHTSESYELINDILRCEWNYTGLVMTDWIKTGRSFSNKSIYKAPNASLNIKAGNDLTMPGYSKDYKDIMKALKKGIISRDDLINSASRIYRSILLQKN